MISVKVTYTVDPSFVAQNTKNIQFFLADFKKMSSVSFMYNVYLQEDGQTFLHIAMYENEEVQELVMQVPSFVQFQKARDERGLNGSHKVEKLQLIGSSLGLLKE